MSAPAPAITRFLRKIIISDSGCWLWTAALNVKGYAIFNAERDGYNSGLAHNFAFEYYRGRPPAGTEPDHLCRVRPCVNPWHLEAVTHLDNIRRGTKGHVTHCLRGHEYTDTNTVHLRNGHRRCHTCKQVAYEQDRRKRGVPTWKEWVASGEPKRRKLLRTWDALLSAT